MGVSAANPRASASHVNTAPSSQRTGPRAGSGARVEFIYTPDGSKFRLSFKALRMREPRASGLVRDKRVDVFDTSVSVMADTGDKRGLGHRRCRRETVSQRALRHT